MASKFLERNIRVASGRDKADLVLKNAKIVNVFTETIEMGNIAINEGTIVGVGEYAGEDEVDLQGAYVCPGLIDGHVHLESSMVSPVEFERLVMQHGTTAVVTDPHEIANVAGIAGIKYMMQTAEQLDLDIYFMLPSCVPATNLDEAGAVLHADDLNEFMANDSVLGLAEMMNSYGVIHGEKECLEKIQLAVGKNMDGHAPFLSGKDLNAYIVAGIQSDHECSNIEEAKEKMARGQWIMIREGTAAKNLESLFPLFESPYYQRAMLVTDDIHPGDLLRKGHIDGIIRQAVALGADPIHAIRMGTLHTATYFGLNHLGAVAPGYQADLVVVDDLTDFRIEKVYKKGKLIADAKKFYGENRINKCSSETIEQRVFHSFHMNSITLDDLKMDICGEKQRVIDLVSHELITKERIVEAKEMSGCAPGVDVERDIVKLAVFERHHKTGHVGLGFLGKYGLKTGAVATSVGHDSHNLIIAGVNDYDMVLAGNAVIANGGGLAIANHGKVVAELALPIAGLMADSTVEQVDFELETMKDTLRTMGISENIDAFMTLAFISLPVIPSLRLNSRGMIKVDTQEIVKAFF